MPVFILKVKVPSAPKRSVEIMIKGDTLDDALRGAEVVVLSQQRTVEMKPYTFKGCTPGSTFRHIYYKRRMMKMVLLGEPIEVLPF